MRGDDMKKYTEPTMIMLNLSVLDIITASSGLAESAEGIGDTRSYTNIDGWTEL